MNLLKQNLKQISKYLSLVLRHKPEELGLTLNQEGWMVIDDLLRAMDISKATLDDIVFNNDKQRFSYSSDGQYIRASQGHSVKTVSLSLRSVKPPECLYHGTVGKFLESIQTSGLEKRQRQHVHLSTTVEVAKSVGARCGQPILLTVSSGRMYNAGYEFYLSDNNVWLTEHVPPEFIEF